MITIRSAVLFTILMAIKVDIYAGEPMLSIAGPGVDERGYFLTVSLHNGQDTPLVVDCSLRLGIELQVFDADGKLIELKKAVDDSAKPLGLHQTMVHLPPGWRTERRLYFGCPTDSLVIAQPSDIKGKPTRVHCYYSQILFPAVDEVNRIEIRLDYAGDALTAATSVFGRKIQDSIFNGVLKASWTKETRKVPAFLRNDLP